MSHQSPTTDKPVWQRWWFIVGAVVVVLLVVGAAIALTQNDSADVAAAPAPAASAAGSPGAPPQPVVVVSAACEQALASAGAISALIPAFGACATSDEFVAAAAKFPAALGGVDPAFYVANNCAVNAEVSTSRLCKSLAGS